MSPRHRRKTSSARSVTQAVRRKTSGARSVAQAVFCSSCYSSFVSFLPVCFFVFCLFLCLLSDSPSSACFVVFCFFVFCFFVFCFFVLLFVVLFVSSWFAFVFVFCVFFCIGALSWGRLPGPEGGSLAETFRPQLPPLCGKLPPVCGKLPPVCGKLVIICGKLSNQFSKSWPGGAHNPMC